MAAAIAFPPAGLDYNHATATIDIPDAHAFNQYFSIMGTPNAGAGTRNYSIQVLQMLAFSLSRRNPANTAELNNVFHGVDNVNEVAVLQTIETAINAGFTHNVVATGTPLVNGYDIVRAAQMWAQGNVSRLRPMMAADFYALPVMAGGAPVRFRMSFALFEEQGTGVLRPMAELIGLGGYLHDAATRNNTSPFAVVFDTIVNYLSNPPLAVQPMAVARAISQSGVPPELAVYPIAPADQYIQLLFRLHYLAGRPHEQRAAFASYSQLLLKNSVTLRNFLQPAASEEQLTSAYSLMVSRIYTSQHPPSPSVHYRLETATALVALLDQMPEVVVTANMTGGDAMVRAQAAVAEFDRRRSVVSNTGTGSTTSTHCN